MEQQFSHPKVEMLPTASLRPDPRNARTHTDKQVRQIAASIDRFGWLVPIVIDDATGLIAAGHARWRAAKLNKKSEVPVIRARFLTDEDRRAFALGESRLAQLAGWDDKLLNEELTALFGSGYNIEVTGFTTADLDFSVPEQKCSDEPDNVELPDLAAAAVSRVGDLWHIGFHRLLCGDARSVASYEHLLGDERAAIIFADFPYNIPISGFVSGGTHHREFVMGVGEWSRSEFTAFMRTVFRNLVRFSTQGSIHYATMDWRHMGEVLDAADGVYSPLKQLIVWDKGVGGQGSFYRSQHELVFVFKSGKGPHTNNFGLGETGRYRTNVVKYAGANSFRKGRARDLADHSTVKPTALIADFLLDCSHRGDLVLDPTVGSGSTLIAAHKTARRGAGIELDPHYVDTALKRLADATGLVPILDGDGRSFADIADERRKQVES